MTNRDADLPDVGPIDRPATWENELQGRLEQAVGTVTGDEDRAEEGEQQVEIAHEVREKYREQRRD